MNSEPTTNPTDVSPSWRPYSNSVAWRTRNANGSRRTFQSPTEKKYGTAIRKIVRNAGVPTSTANPSRRLVTTTPTDVGWSCGGAGRAWIREINAAETRNVIESIQNAQVRSNTDARRPAPANPIAVEPNDAIWRNELAAASSSSVARSGMMLSLAGSKNCLTAALARMIA